MDDPAQRIQHELGRSHAAWLRGDLPAMRQALRALLGQMAALAHEGRVPHLEKPAAPWDRRLAEAMVWRLLARLKSEGCFAFPYAGTLLGLERDGQLLDNDKDADLALWLEDFTLAGRVLQAIGLRRAQDVPPFGNVATYVDPLNGYSVDLFGVWRDPAGGGVLGGAWLYGHPADHQRVLRLPAIELVPRAGPDGAVWWPREPAQLLQAFYGDDWRTPQPEWDTLVSNRALVEVNLNWWCCALKSLAERWLGGDLARTRRLAAAIRARAGDDPELASWCDALDEGLRRLGAAS